MIIHLQLVSWMMATVAVNSMVLDPSLYLSPSPPLSPSREDLSPNELWTQSLEDLKVKRNVDNAEETDDIKPTTEVLESMERAETFWPSIRSADYTLRGIHVPITFSISGSYGKYGSGGMGVIGSTYGGVDQDSYGNYGKMALAGSSYGVYSGYPGTRIFSGDNKPSWSGWGNGRWGHYGKG